MTTSKTNGVGMRSVPAPQTLPLQEFTGVASGAMVTYQCNNFQSVMADAKNRGLRMNAIAVIATVEQSVEVADAPITGPFYSGQANRRALDTFNIQVPIAGTQFLNVQGDDTESPSAINFAARNFISPELFSRIAQTIPGVTGPFPAYGRSDMTYGSMGLQGTDGDDGVDSLQSWWGADDKTRLVAAQFGTGPVTEDGGLAPEDFCIVPFCMASADPSGDVIPLECIVNATQFATFSYTPRNNTAAYPAGTTFGEFTVRFYLRVSYSRDDGSTPIVGNLYALDRWSSGFPVNPPVTDHAVLLATAPEFRSTATQLIEAGYSPRIAFQIPQLETYFDGTAKLRWYEPGEDGALRQVQPISDNYLRPDHILDVWNAAECSQFGGSKNPYAARAMKFRPDTTSTLFSDFLAGAVRFAANGRTDGGLTNRIEPISPLPMFPLLFVYTGMRGFPGGPYVGGQLTCPGQIQLEGVVLASPWQEGTQFRFLRVRLRPELQQKFLNATSCAASCGGSVPMAPIVDNPESPKAEAVSELVPKEAALPSGSMQKS